MLKKFLSLLISLLMLFSVAVSASGSGSGAAGGASGGGIAGSGNSGTPTTPSTGATSSLTMLDSEVTIVNGTAYQVGVDIENLKENAVLRIALYNGNQLTGFINRTIYSDTVAGGTATFLINAGESDKAKVFLFDKTSPLSVLCSQEKDLTQALDLMLTMSGATVSGGTYKNVTVSSAVGDGEVFLNDVEIKGDLNIYGGGNNSIELFGCKVDGKILMAKEAGGTPPRLYLSNTPVSKIDISRDALIEAADAASAIDEIDTVVGVDVQGANTVVNKINVSENSTGTVSIGGTAAINEVVAKAPIMVMSETIKKVEIPADATRKINVNVMVNANLEIEVNNSNGADITADIPGTNVTVSTELDNAPEVTIGGEKIEHIHKWNEGTVISEPTYAEEGSKVSNCACGESKTESIPKLVGKDFYKFVENYNGSPLRISWEPSSLLTDGKYYLRFNGSTQTTIGTSKTVTGIAPALMEEALPMVLSLQIYKGNNFSDYTPLYPSADIANVTVTAGVPQFTIEKDASGNYNFISDMKGGMWLYSIYDENGLYYQDNDVNGAISPYAPQKLADGDIVKARYLTWTLNADNTYADINITMPKSVTYNEPDEDEETTISFRKWKTDIMFDGYEEVADTKSLEVNGVKVVSGNAETMSEFLFEYDQTKGNITGADFVVELDGVEKDRIPGNVTVTISNEEVPFSVNSDGTLSFDETANGCYAYKTTKGGAGRIAFTNGALADGWDLPTLSVGETIDIMHIDCTYDENTKVISATLSKHTTKTYTVASDGNIWFSETDYGYPCVEWTAAELSDNEFYVCNDMEWFDTTGYLYFELLDIEESGYIPITISRGTWENKTPLYTSNEAAHVTITDTEQNLSLVEQSDGRYKITSHLNNFDAQCFVYQVRSKAGSPLLTGFTTGKIYVSPHEDIEVIVRQVKWNISSDKKQIEYTITPTYKITTYTDTQTQTEVTYVSTYDEMKAALNKGGVVKLNADINTTSRLTLNTGDAATLDLNGHTLDIPNIEARNGKNLTINQTASGSRLINSNGTQEVSVYYGDLTLNGGSYEKIGSQHANNITLNGISGSYNDYSFYYGKNVSITDCTFGSAENASRINVWEADKATITDTVVYGNNSAVDFSSVDKAVVENTTVNASYYAISCQTNTNLELKNVNATAESETIRVHSGCNVTIDGGEYEVTSSSSNLMYMISGPTVTIKGGKFKGGKNLASPSAANVGTLNISGGDFTYYTNALLGRAMTCNISGGSFGCDVSEYLEDGCTFTNNSDGTYTISPKAEAAISNLRIAPYVSTIYAIHWDGEAPTGPSGNYYKVYGTSDGGTTWELIGYAYYETKYPLFSQSATNYNGIKVEYIKAGTVAATVTDLTFNIKSEVIASSFAPSATFAEPDASGQTAVTITGLTPNTYFCFVVDGKVAGMSTKSFRTTSSTSGSTEGRLSLSADEIQNGSYKVYEFVNPTISDDGKNFSYAVAESAWQNCKNIQ